ncbi:hypothetical protein GCM10010967_32860 [Dyadobacter beijingensis]|uniref:HTH araC/xylS-type domain-containing protein n=1 Tax=Dyadobacter beijingensis TaxID=365489 RepID=A0ABQ2I027_9BACT|nr:AraC family transcriptional regulator [Dyadobacter beijingensis]GGM96585.1 hypothetical protein GCM10010967_32860 [Dyadobacter beijingensis]
MQTQNRYGVKIAVGLGSTIDLEINGLSQKGVRGFIIDRNVRHRCICEGTILFISLIEPASRWGRDLRLQLSGREFCVIEEVIALGEIDAIMPVGVEQMEPREVARRVQTFFMRIFEKVQRSQARTMDDRMERVVAYIDSNLTKNIELSEVANLAYLSPHRFRHLFTEQVGLPFTQYIIWQRLKKSVHAIATGDMTLGEAVEKFGFTDQAHFSNAFKKMFGVFPRAFLQTSLIVLPAPGHKE